MGRAGQVRRRKLWRHGHGRDGVERAAGAGAGARQGPARATAAARLPRPARQFRQGGVGRYVRARGAEELRHLLQQRAAPDGARRHLSAAHHRHRRHQPEHRPLDRPLRNTASSSKTGTTSAPITTAL
ncbi:hypothetical protein G6F32_016338 [Rhizopus arrhizus]|nr:hypothetical protein G6F32_016338 [Rhizopus arrhizus]